MRSVAIELGLEIDVRISDYGYRYIFQAARTYAYDVVGVAPIRELSALVPDLAVSELHLRTEGI